MDKPTTYAYSDEATFSFRKGVVLIPIIFITSGFVFVLATSDITLSELAVPLIGMSGMVLIILGIFGSVVLGHRLFEKRAINRLFAGNIWECWQFSASEWNAQVEKVCNQISPKDKEGEAYSGVIASSIFGFVIALIIIVLTIFVKGMEDIKTEMRIVAVGLFLFMIGVGLFQPVDARRKADRYRRKAMRFTEPRVWFGPEGVYHEALGHTSLKELHRVTDQTKSRNAIQFKVVVSSDTYDDFVKIRFPVPSGCKERAGSLVLRYRRELQQE